MDVFCLAIGVAVAEMGIVADYTLSHQVSLFLCTVAFHTNTAHDLTYYPSIIFDHFKTYYAHDQGEFLYIPLTFHANPTHNLTPPGP